MPESAHSDTLSCANAQPAQLPTDSIECHVTSVTEQDVCPNLMCDDAREYAYPYSEPKNLSELLHLLATPATPGVTRVLHVFSGVANRPGSLGAAIRALGHECVEIDILNGEFHDVRQPALAQACIAAFDTSDI